MRYLKPHFYDQFVCTAGDCPDTCCAGWQIVIENKIRSKVATIKRHTQLDNYRRYVEKTMPDDYDRTLFILLSHRDNSA